LADTTPLVFISSDYVFDGGDPPYREDDERRPVNHYGRMKVQAENLVLERDAGLVVRIPLLIGAGPSWEESGFLFATFAAIRDPRPAALDHLGIRFPTWTDDVAEAVAHLIELGARGAYHCSSPAGGTKYEWAVELARLAGLSVRHITPYRKAQAAGAPRPGNTQLAVEKIKGSGFDRFTPFKDVAESVLRQFSVL
jgi:dTDP-4-dehydrorhamnose reductase